MKLKKLATALAVTAAFGAGMSSQARADALAQSAILITNFLLTNAAGGVTTAPLALTDFSQLSFLDQVSGSAGLNGNFAFQGASGNIPGGTVDPLQACQGTCPGQNIFVPVAAPPVNTYSRSDGILFGAPISGTPAPLGANSLNIAETSLRGTVFGNSNSTTQLSASFTFVLAHALNSVGFRFNAQDYLRSWTAAGSNAGTSAAAGVTWQLTLKDGGTTLINWLPDGSIVTGAQTGLNVIAEGCDLNRSTSATFNDPQAAFSCTGAFEAIYTGALAAGRSYSFVISQTVQAQASAVPEPGSLALLGLGLAGLGFSAYRRKK